MKRIYLLSIIFLTAVAFAQSSGTVQYRVADSIWTESLGSQRAVLNVESAADAVSLDLPWRRADKNVADKQFIIINAANGERVANIKRLSVSNERCNLLFGPVVAGTYYFYYLPYQVVDGHGGYGKNYLPRESSPALAWKLFKTKYSDYPQASVECIESRTAFDSFFPMEQIVTAHEWNNYKLDNCDQYWVFPEVRDYPIRMKHNVPYKWLSVAQGSALVDEACKNEYFALQIGVVAGEYQLKNVRLEYSSLRSGGNEIPADAFVCYNTDGVDPLGKPFVKEVNVMPGDVQPMWVGIDIPASQPAGLYKGEIKVVADGFETKIVPIELTVNNTVIEERGDNEPWRHSRLRWLNSTRGIDDNPTAEYQNVKVSDMQLECLGRQVQLDAGTGLPAQIVSWGHELLTAPIAFTVETSQGVQQLTAKPAVTEVKSGKIEWKWEASNDALKLQCTGIMEFDGWMDFHYTITALKNIAVKDVRLEIAMKPSEALYTMGMGMEGQAVPDSYKTGWVNPTGGLQPFDSFWLGSAYGGIHCELRGTTYSGPLLNLYRPAPPEGWFNKNKGSLSMVKGKDAVVANVASGSFEMEANNTKEFEWAFIITPVRALDSKRQFTERYYHKGSLPEPTKDDVKAGVKVINVHHANYYNPFINYPFLTAPRLKDFISDMHKQGCKVKMYYTIRELTNVVTEVWALRSLGYEILADGRGGGFPWLREHFIDHYYPQWYHHFPDGKGLDGVVADASVLTATGQSRWYNYYIEGLAWMIKHTDVDGLYLDDVSFDRNMMKRIRKTMAQVKPGCVIDLHSNTGFSKGPAIQYTEFFPYIDKVWFGESFLYNKMSPENWLVEVSGIPFGHMGDMLHGGGNKWLGMQYGMTVRHPWTTEGVICDPRLIWKEWDRFGIADSKMVGFWDENPIITTSDPAVKATVYLKKGKALLSLGNYSDSSKDITLNIDWKGLGLNPKKAKLKAYAIDGFQQENTYNQSQTITIKPREGLLIEIK